MLNILILDNDKQATEGFKTEAGVKGHIRRHCKEKTYFCRDEWQQEFNVKLLS